MRSLHLSFLEPFASSFYFSIEGEGYFQKVRLVFGLIRRFEGSAVSFLIERL